MRTAIQPCAFGKVELGASMTEDKDNQIAELWEMVSTFSQHVDNLKASLESERHRSKELNSENIGWLGVYQKLQSQIAGLKAEISHLEFRIQCYQRASSSE
jgi:peptidoglycan hydrolase CwlO-like protein